MDVRVLRYFLAVAREESLSAAAESLHITQPTLSRQIMDLEEELGCKLFTRGNRKVKLTENGMLLRKRAEEITSLFDMTYAEFDASANLISGDIYIGGGESDAMRMIARTAKRLKKDYPNVRYHLYSGNAEDVTDKLDKGLIDFGILIEPADIKKYDFMKIPAWDHWGLLMRKDAPLAKKSTILPEDLLKLPIISSRQTMIDNEFSGWLKHDFSQLNIVATYNLVYNASLLVEEGLGYALCLDKLVNTTGDSSLCFVPLDPKIEVGLDIVWKKYKIFSKPAAKFLEYIQEDFR